MLYTLNLHNVTCQLYLSKVGGNKPIQKAPLQQKQTCLGYLHKGWGWEGNENKILQQDL